MTLDFTTPFSAPFLRDYQRGVMSYKYKDSLCNKSPLDLAIYLRILWDLKPASLIEIGYKGGGSALWFADMTRVLGLDTRVLSVDLTPPQQRFDERVTFVRGDTNHLEDALTAEVLGELPRPWLVVEDSAHTFAACLAALRFFASHMQPGELLVIEDGILTDLGLSEDYDGGPNRAVAEFCAGAPAVFAVDRDYCDMFGRNATYNPNGYLRRTSMAFP